jgi:hypothetical protein
MEAIQAAIENEIERRTRERITNILEKISLTYDIRLERLLKDMSQERGPAGNGCHGLTKTGKRCSRAGKFEGYCAIHVSQKPDIRKSCGILSASSVKHTHTLPPLFLKGCPACDLRKREPIEI